MRHSNVGFVRRNLGLIPEWCERDGILKAVIKNELLGYIRLQWYMNDAVNFDQMGIVQVPARRMRLAKSTSEEINMWACSSPAKSIMIYSVILYSRLRLSQIECSQGGGGRQTAVFIQTIFSKYGVSTIGLTWMGRAYIATTFAGHLLWVSWYFVHQARTT
jgi:hypothetical protein